ncbi:MAG: UDP-N-acetylmuramyl-tripeptide synthetase [Patescibacteria group bacterium]|nr:UDP-N-acetylmuramyl-tripeptide synthetase [Patescibacteria group bacterium]
MHGLKSIVRALVPSGLLALYHFSLAYIAAAVYRHPSRDITVIGITGTDGKSSTVEFLNAILESAGRNTALSSSIRVKVGVHSSPSAGRSMPGRLFIQNFLRRACAADCDIAIVEMTSEGARQYRHRFLELDALLFLNLSPEHVESHGSYQAYADAKFQLGKQLARSRKRPRIIVANAEDKEGSRYLSLPVEKKIPFSLKESAPYDADEKRGHFTFRGHRMTTALPGTFTLQNALAAACAASALGIPTEDIARGVASVSRIPGRTDPVDAGQDFLVIVDYALTPDALEKLYQTYADRPKICVFGAAGNRDKWKRPVLGEIAERYCEQVILTNDVAYDENPRKIVDDIARGMTSAPEIFLDRRAAIRRALNLAQAHTERSRVAVLITGMGIDTEITAGDGSTVPWNDIEVAREELKALLQSRL